VLDDVLLLGLDPATVFGEMGVGVEGVDDDVAGGLHLAGTLEDEFKRGADMSSPAVE